MRKMYWIALKALTHTQISIPYCICTDSSPFRWLWLPHSTRITLYYYCVVFFFAFSLAISIKIAARKTSSRRFFRNSKNCRIQIVLIIQRSNHGRSEQAREQNGNESNVIVVTLFVYEWWYFRQDIIISFFFSYTFLLLSTLFIALLIAPFTNSVVASCSRIIFYRNITINTFILRFRFHILHAKTREGHRSSTNKPNNVMLAVVEYARAMTRGACGSIISFKPNIWLLLYNPEILYYISYTY